MVPLPGNQAANGEDKPQRVASRETGLLHPLTGRTPSHMDKARLKYGLKIAISLSIIGYILTRIEWGEFFTTVSRASMWLLVLALGQLLIERVWAVFKWRELIRAAGAPVSMWGLLYSYCIGSFWGMFLPSSLSTDVLRGYYFASHYADPALAAASVVVDRMMGMFSLFAFAVTGLLFGGGLFGNSILVAVVLLMLGGMAAAALLLRDKVLGWLEQKISFFSSNTIGMKLIKVHRCLQSFGRCPAALALSFFYSLILQAIRVLTIYITARAFFLDVSLAMVFFVVPVSMIIIMIPVSIGGFGVREGSFVALFSLAGLSINDSFLVAFTNSIQATTVTIIGGLIFIFFKNDFKPKENAHQAE